MKQERLRRGMTQQELADKCGQAGAAVDESHISRIERGIYSPRPRLRAVLANLLGLEVDLEQLAQPEHELSGSRA